MDDVIRLGEAYYIVADTDRPAAPLRVLKQGDAFSVFDQHGDIAQHSDVAQHGSGDIVQRAELSPTEAGEQGIYHDGTRFLSRFELLLGRTRPLLLSSTISDDNASFTANLTNPDILRDGRILVPRGEIHVFRSRVLWAACCHERIRVSNYALHPVELPITLRFDSDFADVFEVRGTRRERRGERLPTRIGEDPGQGGTAPDITMPYRGLDGVERRTRIRWSECPATLEDGAATFLLALRPHETRTIDMTICCETAAAPVPRARTFDIACAVAVERLAEHETSQARLSSSSESLNRWIRRSTSDLRMMLTQTPHGMYPYAGIPWFSTPFGRDGLITAFELLWADPAVARGVLTFLAETQATTYDDRRDAQPGKILHEMRGGEMAALGEVPFGRYYGTADATPLFVALAHAYLLRTADHALIDRLWPNIVAALGWMERDGDVDADGFIEYARQASSGLVQQGWKDSHDSVFHADGVLAEPPIAVCEVQGYAYAAWSGAGHLATLRGEAGKADAWRRRAESLRAQFERAFWCSELGTYALALDGHKRPCRVRTSNAGHCLFAGIALDERARQVASTLMSEASFAGWGIRTVAAGEARYNPMSYHNGSVWPHDNALIAAGLARYGDHESARRVLEAMSDLSQVVDLYRLPELICGFHRRGGEHPTLYPVACAPQSWAAGAVYLLIQACLGLRIDAPERRVSFTRSLLPRGIEWLHISNLVVGDATLDLRLERHPNDVGITVVRRDGDVEVVSIK